MRWTGWLAGVLLLGLAATAARTDEAAPWTGDWVTDRGPVVLKQEGTEVTGTYGLVGEVKGSVEGRKLALEFGQVDMEGEASLEIAGDGASFQGTWKRDKAEGTWLGWKQDPQAEAATPADFAGVWVSSLGPLQVEQTGTAVKGTYSAPGGPALEGTVKGRRLHLVWKRLQGTLPAWLEQTADGSRVFGLIDGEPKTAWLGRRLAGVERHPKPKAGAIVEGLAGNGLLYALHTPASWKKGRPTDALLLLHDAKGTAKALVALAARLPGIGDRCFVLGLEGDAWDPSSAVNEPRLDYGQAAWAGRRPAKTLPDAPPARPNLVVQAAGELKVEHGFGRTFLAGHGDGGSLAYMLHMHFPETWAGTIPMSCRLPPSADPDGFGDAALRAAERAIPLAIVHGTTDDVVPYEAARSAHEQFLAGGFSLLRHFAPPSGHAFDYLPLAEVLPWLEALSTKDAAVLATFARERADAGAWRDAAAAVERAKVLKAEAKVADVAKRLDVAAKKDAPALLAKVKANTDGSWVDAYLAWQDQFEFAPSAKPLLDAYRAVQEEHGFVGEKRLMEARSCFENGDEEGGWAKYQEVVNLYWGSKAYRAAKRLLAGRK